MELLKTQYQHQASTLSQMMGEQIQRPGNITKTKSTTNTLAGVRISAHPMQRLGLLTLGMSAALLANGRLANAAKVTGIYTGERWPAIAIAATPCDTMETACYTKPVHNINSNSTISDDTPCPCDATASMPQDSVLIHYDADQANLQIDSVQTAPNQQTVLSQKGLSDRAAFCDTLDMGDRALLRSECASPNIPGGKTRNTLNQQGNPVIFSGGGAEAHVRTQGDCQAKACAPTAYSLNIQDNANNDATFDAGAINAGTEAVFYKNERLLKQNFCAKMDAENQKTWRILPISTPGNLIDAQAFCHPTKSAALKYIFAIMAAGIGLGLAALGANTLRKNADLRKTEEQLPLTLADLPGYDATHSINV